MEKGKVLEKLSAAMLAANTEALGPMHICWFGGQIQCMNSDHTNINHLVFMKLNRTHRTKGLNSDEWDKLGDAVFKHIDTIGKGKS